MKRTMTIGVILLLAGMLAVPVFAFGPGRGRTGGAGEGQGQRQPFCLPNLTEEQQAKVEALFQSHREETMPIHNELRAKRAELRALMLAKTLDEAKVRAVQGEINTLQKDLSNKRLDMQIELRKIDPNARFGGRFAGRFGRGGKGGKRGGGTAPQWDEDPYGGGRGPGACW